MKTSTDINQLRAYVNDLENALKDAEYTIDSLFNQLRSEFEYVKDMINDDVVDDIETLENIKE